MKIEDQAVAISFVTEIQRHHIRITLIYHPNMGDTAFLLSAQRHTWRMFQSEVSLQYLTKLLRPCQALSKLHLAASVLLEYAVNNYEIACTFERGFLQGFVSIESHGGYGHPTPLNDTYDFAIKTILNGIRDLQGGTE